MYKLSRTIISVLLFCMVTPLSAHTPDGAFATVKEQKGKYILGIHRKLLSRHFLLANRIVSTSGPEILMAGKMVDKPILLSLTADKQYLYVHKPQWEVRGDSTESIYKSLQRNYQPPIVYSLKLVSQTTDSLFVDITSTFTGNTPGITPMGAGAKSSGSFIAEGSRILSVKAFESNLEVKSRMNYRLGKLNYLFEVQRSIVLLPEKPMQIRTANKAVGFFNSKFEKVSDKSDFTETVNFIHRWNIVPPDSLWNSYLSGQLVQPTRQIVFYIDNAFPEKWLPAIVKGVERWNIAFERAGFKNVLKAIPYPNDGDFDPDDIRNNCIRYVINSKANAQGPSYIDPRSGEILNASILWFHKVTERIHTWRLFHTGVADADVRQPVLPDSVMAESISYVIAHEVGHTLGLMHNMGASSAIPTDSLRSASYTRSIGITPSIMDYSRFNYAAQSGDKEKGVVLSQQHLGLYDLMAIEWAYRRYGSEEDSEQTNKMLLKYRNNKLYRFGPQQFAYQADPENLTEDLGDNHLKASVWAIRNISQVVRQLEQWCPGNTNKSFRKRMYMAACPMYGTYIAHVLSYVGGEVSNGTEEYIEPVDKQQQTDALQFVVKQLVDSENWFAHLKKGSDLRMNLDKEIKDLRKNLMMSLLHNNRLYRLAFGSERSAKSNPFTLASFMDRLSKHVLLIPSAELSDVRKELQTILVHRYLELLKSTDPEMGAKILPEVWKQLSAFRQYYRSSANPYIQVLLKQVKKGME